jgi:regulator of replication initiation timing
VTQAVKRTPADVLREARRRDSHRKRNRVFRTVDAMKRDGTPISFAAVARTAKVSQWLVYADGVREYREYIETARSVQATEPAQAKRPGRSASEASLRTDLQLTKQDNRRLRGEADRLKKALRERLGAQLEAESAESLRRRIDELITANDRYRSENSRLTTELNDTRQRLRMTEDELGAARTSLRRMIRERSAQIPTSTLT